jgi:putative inorganic carbon (HCO3(-)) transporter
MDRAAAPPRSRGADVPQRRTSTPGTAARRPLGLFAAAVAFLLPVVFSPSTNSTFWAPKAALLPVVAAVGLPYLVRLRREPAAIAAAAFLGIAALATLLAATPTVAVFGLYGQGTGLLFVAALVGAWAIGRVLVDDERADVGRALLGGVLLNVAFALLSTIVDLTSFELGLYQGRAMGLLGNPIHLGAACAAGLALLVPRLTTNTPAAAAGVAAIGAAVQASGSRSGLVAALVVIAWGVAVLSRRHAAVLVVAMHLGFAGGWALSEIGGGVSVSQRLAADDGGGGLGARASQWWSTRHAVADQPLLGSGPGTYREATSRYRTDEVAATFGGDTYYGDAHNVFVEYAGTTGLLGVAAFGAWLALAARRARGPLAVAALAILLVGLVEPQWVGTTPVAFLALGAAGPRAPTDRRASWPVGLLAAAGVAASAVFLVGDFHLHQARLDFDRGHADAALQLLPRWSEPATIRARIDTLPGRIQQDEALLASARRWRLEAIARDPTDPQLWLILADADATEGRTDEAIRAYQQVLRLNPQSTRARTGLVQLQATEP